MRDDATDFFAMEVTPITTKPTIHSLRLKLNWATDLGRDISFAAHCGGSAGVGRRNPETATDNVAARARVATTDICELVTGYYRSGNEQRRERAEAPLSRALTIHDRHVVALKAPSALSVGHFSTGKLSLACQGRGFPPSTEEESHHARTADAPDPNIRARSHTGGT
jgi:hypothetical protein